jgi:AAA ATPase domain/Tetratricopeptide repeat
MTARDSVPRSPTSALFDRSARLYGRAAELDQVTNILAHPTTTAQAIVLEGEGGTGKTSLLRRIEHYLREQRMAFLPLYDFYHIDNFKASSIETAIIEALDSISAEASDLFRPYARQREELEHARQSGDAFQQAQQGTRASFIDCYNQFAEHTRERGQPVVLLFDSVEQAVDLSDDAEAYMGGISATASKGGAFWLAATLPDLRNTVCILAGREQTLYGQQVALYEQLRQAMTVHPIALRGIPLAAERQFITDQRAALLTEDTAEDVRELAQSIEINDQTFIVWRAIADGIPFWDSMLLTSAMLGAIPPEVDRLREAVFAGQPINVSPDQRRCLRAAIMQQILAQGVSANDQPLILVLQWMSFIRKGATPALLQAIARDQAIDIDIVHVYERLKRLDIVKTRRSPYATTSDPEPDDMLFLHDELYRWLDQDLPTQQQLRQVVSAAVMRFYDQAINATEQRRLAAKDRLLELGAAHSEASALRSADKEALRRRQQLELDRLGYCYQAGLVIGTQVYNLHSYAAILERDLGYSITLRQEALRNIYRQRDTVPFAIVVECAARWMLRAVQTDDPHTMQLVEQLQYYYDQEAAQPGLHYALLYLADAQARAYLGNRAARAIAIEQLQHAETIALAYEQDYRAQHSHTTDPWCDFLLAQIYNWRGYYYRLEYNLPQAIEDYRRAMSCYVRHPALLRAFQGSTLNNLAFACAEQGEVEEARRFGQQALAILQRQGGEYRIGLSYNALARIEIRGGLPQRATQLARQAQTLFEQIGSLRGQSLALPVLGESYRKQADQQAYSISEQEAIFAQSVTKLKQAIDLMDREQITASARRCEAYQRLGCVYRSWGVALLRRRSHDPITARHYFAEAQRWLERALAVAEPDLPALLVMDIYQDLAVVLVNQDQFDQRVEDLLKQAEALAPPAYRIEQGIGLRDIAQPVRAFWRILGQCELQRMLIGFGTFDFGEYQLDTDGAPSYHGQHDERFLKEAARHLVLALAYLLKYAYQSPLLNQARALALRELRLGRDERQLKLMAQEAYQTAREYRLLNGQELKLASGLMLQAERDLDLPLDLIQS